MKDTRTIIIEHAEELVLSKGYNAFSYADISKPLDIKNAAVHYHFPTKEDLGIAIVKKQADDFRQLRSITEGKSPKESMLALKDFYMQYVREKKVCMIGSMGTDLLTLPESVQAELRVQLENIWQWLTVQLGVGKQNGDFKFEADAQIKAMDFLSNLSAGAQITRIKGNPQIFNELMDSFFNEIEK
jgi:TetR/AcrR family transcriptional regulator, transcriptional repressor for nem operon